MVKLIASTLTEFCFREAKNALHNSSRKAKLSGAEFVASQENILDFCF